MGLGTAFAISWHCYYYLRLLFLIISLVLLSKLNLLPEIPPLEPCLCELGLGPGWVGGYLTLGSLRRHRAQSVTFLFISEQCTGSTVSCKASSPCCRSSGWWVTFTFFLCHFLSIRVNGKRTQGLKLGPGFKSRHFQFTSCGLVPGASFSLNFLNWKMDVITPTIQGYCENHVRNRCRSS